jgi:hypothetical protein
MAIDMLVSDEIGQPLKPCSSNSPCFSLCVSRNQINKRKQKNIDKTDQGFENRVPKNYSDLKQKHLAKEKFYNEKHYNFYFP